MHDSQGKKPEAWPEGGQAGEASGNNGRRQGPAGSLTYAALDLGTNNCRLLVARPCATGFQVVDAFSRIVRLGEGLDANGELTEAAISRTISALRVCAGKIRRHRVAAARVVATAACRQARNCNAFIARVKRETGLQLEIISTDEEARLALAGCVSLLDPEPDNALVFDIGGGSTELVWLGKEANAEDLYSIIASVSLPCGVVSLSERFGGRELRPDSYDAMIDEVAVMLAPFADRHGLNGAPPGSAQMLGTSGTVTTLAALHLGLDRYDRSRVDGSYLSFDDLAVVRARLREMSYEDRRALSCIGRGRADLVLAGSAILDAICHRWPLGRLRVADRGLREGILHGLMGRGARSGVAPVGPSA